MPAPKNLLGQTFNRLTVIEKITDNRKIKGMTCWLCSCNCGRKIVVPGKSLISNNTKSCGCFSRELSAAKFNSLNENRRSVEKFIISNENKVYALYKKDGLQFDSFIKMIYSNCFYCGSPPSNLSKTSKHNASPLRKSVMLKYSGIDRINSSLGHIEGNCRSCCIICNRSKSDHSEDKFYLMIKKVVNYNERWIPLLSTNKNYLHENLINEKFIRENPYKHIKRQFIRTELGKQINWHWYVVYGDGNLKFEEYAYLLTLPCFYCGEKSSNNIAYKMPEGIKYYKCNGLDRLDNNLPHNLDNCVPCCKICNMAKGKMNFNEFINWANKIYTHLSLDPI